MPEDVKRERKIPVQVRLTETEYKMLEQQAAARGLKLAQYIRTLLYERAGNGKEKK